MTGLYQSVRPTILGDVIGQPAAVAQIRAMIDSAEVSHAILFSGPSGTGKTTLARILAKELGSEGKFDLQEVNCASNNGVDFIRGIENNVPLRQLSGKNRVYIIDECHQLTSQAQRAFLKLLEDTPPHIYFFLCTTNPEKLEKPLRTRCTPVALGLVPTTVIKGYMRCLEDETGPIASNIPDKSLIAIAEASGGSVRRALVLLEQVLKTGLEFLPDILGADAEVSSDLFEIVRAIYSSNSVFPAAGEALRSMDDNQVEAFRRSVFGYGAAIIVKTKPNKNTESVARIMSYFREPFWNTGKNGLIFAIYQATKTSIG
jgi:DNA polymerase III subunit gamma/tau